MMERGVPLSEQSMLPGQRLRQERERRGLSVAQVAGELHMDMAIVRALESDDYSPLGAPIFVKGHLRNYARLLGLDSEQVVSDYERAAAPQTPDLVAHKPAGDVVGSARPTSGWLSAVGALLIVILLILLAVWWYYRPVQESVVLGSRNGELAEPAATLSAANLAETAEQSPASPPGTVTATDTADTGVENEPAANSADIGVAEPRASGDETAPLQALPVPSSAAPEPVGEQISVVLSFTGDSWVEVYDAAGEPILYDLGSAGETRRFTARAPLRFFLGNASAVNVRIGGRPFDHAQYQRRDNTARFTLRGE